MTHDFDQLVDTEGLTEAEAERLRRLHEMLVAAGPPAELTATLLSPPDEPALAAGAASALGAGEPAGAEPGAPGGATVTPLPARRRRRAPVAILIAAAVAAACFGGGYLIASQAHGSSISAVRVVSLQGVQNSLASLRVGAADADGNWPMQLTVNGLPKLPGARSYYTLMLVDARGKPTVLCGMFRVDDHAASVRFSVPYRIGDGTRWVVTAWLPGGPWPGHVVMTTT